MMDDETAIRNVLANTEAVYGLYNPFTNEPSGCVSFSNIDPGNDAGCHIVVWDPLWLGRTAIWRAIGRDAMRRWGTRRHTAVIPADKAGINSMMKRIGFKLEGALRNKFRYTDGREVDGLVWGILASELGE